MEVTVESTTSSSITLSWEPPPANCQNGEITGYQIRFTNQSNLSPEEWSTLDVSGTAVGATIEGLESLTEYFICIAARTSVDEYGPCSQPVNTTTHDLQTFPSSTSFPSLHPSLHPSLPSTLHPSLPSSLPSSLPPSLPSTTTVPTTEGSGGFFNAVTIGSIGGGTTGLLVLLILVTVCIAAAVKCRRKKLTLVEKV